MITITHLGVGYVFSKTYCELLGMHCGSEQFFTSTAMVSAILPDIDIFFGKKINEHRNTLFHTPFFWLAVIFSLAIVGSVRKSFWPYVMAISFGVFSHLFFDWFAGRTSGIRIFYPFSRKMHSLFPLNPQKGNVSFIPNRSNKSAYISWIRFYFNNIFLVASEIMIFIIFLWILIFKH